ncbi:MAG: NERD domain-containing protein [Rubrivivax sp.]
MPSVAAMSAGEAAELDVVRRLASGLPEAFAVFHSVEWSTGSADTERHGEVDVIVVNQAGDLLLLEVKSGGVEFRPDGIFKRYGRQTKSVTAQVQMQYAALRSRLQQAGLAVHVHHLLVLPDLQVQSQTVQWPRERIVDCDELETLVSRVMEQLGAGAPGGAVLPRVMAFLENRFRVVPDVSAMAGRLQAVSTRLSAGLATWVPRITVPSGLIRVVGTAGSGKTQLALRLLRDADAAGQRASYICFNRALADHIARFAPVRVLAETFHEHALRVCRRGGMAVDFGEPGVFDRLAQGCIAALRDAESDLDLLVLDEGQDLQPEWVEALLSRLRPHGRGVLLDDPNQQLYADRVSFDLPEAVTITSLENFRTPRALVRLINLLGLCDEALEPRSPFEGEAPDPIVHRDEADGTRATQAAVERCLQRGFPIEQIAVVSLRGRERSALQQAYRLGPWSV